MRSHRQEHYDAALNSVKLPDGKPLVSVIVPVYNAEKHLVRCLDSLVSQTLHDIEILCVNDGSTDTSDIILDEYVQKDSRVFVFNQENKGPGEARNTALDNAQGKYILFCDADDTLEPDAASECLETMETNRVDIVIFNTNIIDVDKVKLGKKNLSGQYISSIGAIYEGILNQRDSFRILLYASASVWGFSFRYDLINRYNLRFPQCRMGEDNIFLLSYLMTIQFGYALNKILYTHYIHKGSLVDVTLDKNPWLRRFVFLPKLLGNIFKFAMTNKKLFKVIYVSYWILGWFQTRRSRI
jgi:glycosyltransferase involved in cell wall biosynthesis